ncbi:hypothetical protein PROFUN_03546 [Planoprotostelium fungivorum]|uniref:Pre-rRNA-processing protein TSR2 n=1 Tax=Planoprotostelium fungivorum TaxID=1890364 RepID=A0A2P6MSF0_9EUKA|nr:hypothetical protein PROFUN_03546 [Planoprotostelium fungivorum]
MASGNVPQTALSKEQKWELFISGVRCIMSRWTALNLAIDNCWGGASSREKADAMFDNLLYAFESSTVHADELVEFFDYYLSNDFHVDAQDGSIEEVSRTIVLMFNRIAIDDFTMVNQILSARVPKGTENSVFQKPPSDDDSSDEGEDEGGDEGMDVEQPTAMNIELEENTRPIKEIDEDGFETVTSRKGRKK